MNANTTSLEKISLTFFKIYTGNQENMLSWFSIRRIGLVKDKYTRNDKNLLSIDVTEEKIRFIKFTITLNVFTFEYPIIILNVTRQRTYYNYSKYYSY